MVFGNLDILWYMIELMFDWLFVVVCECLVVCWLLEFSLEVWLVEVVLCCVLNFMIVYFLVGEVVLVLVVKEILLCVEFFEMDFLVLEG